jgi:leucyl aminopeptidase (aminopeptidase T)
MFQLIKPLEIIAQHCIGIREGERVLLLSDTYAASMRLAHYLFEIALSMGADAVMMVMPPFQVSGEEPPYVVAVAMKESQAVVYVTQGFGPGHSQARVEANRAGARVAHLVDITEEHLLNINLTLGDLQTIETRTLKLADMLTSTRTAHIHSSLGTDLHLSLNGRTAIALHPMSRKGLYGVPDYAEAAIAPVEGSAQGLVVVDGSIPGWQTPLREPFRWKVEGGIVTDIQGEAGAVQRLTKTLDTDPNGRNVAELGIGTSHLVSRDIQGKRPDAAIIGTAHVGVGKNSSIGGKTDSRVHLDGVFTGITRLELDGVAVIENDILMV